MKKITIWIAIVSLMSLSACTASKIEDIGTHTVLNEQVNRTTEIQEYVDTKQRKTASEHILEHPYAFALAANLAMYLAVFLF
ncbi:MAG TPA: hypothetical protein EYQ06_02815 [Flavobacteriales bacterium]|jgi:hypothetical protein|nr:hypothetical protein [Flavobacteriales bacterium]